MSGKSFGRVALLASVWALGACGDDNVTGGPDGTADSDVFVPDTSVDTTPDTTVDTTPDTTVDTTPDTTVDTTPDSDTANDTAVDTDEDTTTDTVGDTTSDTVSDTTDTTDTVGDTTSDTVSDTTTDTTDTVGDTASDTTTDTVSDTTDTTDTVGDTATDTDTVTNGTGESCLTPHVVTLPSPWTAAVTADGDTTALDDDHAVGADECRGMAWEEGFGAGDEVWALTAPSAGVYTITLTSDDADLGLYLLTSCPAAGSPACGGGSDDVGTGAEAPDTVRLSLAAGATVYAVVDAYVDDVTPAATGAYTLTFAAPAPVAAGDSCANARTLTNNGGVFTGTGDNGFTGGATDDYDGAVCGGAGVWGFGEGGLDEVWRFTAPTAGDWQVTVTPTGEGDPLVYAFAGNTCGPTCASESWDDGGAGEAETFDLGQLTAGASATIVVDSFLAAAGGAYTIEVSTCQPSCGVGECGMDDGCGGTCGCGAGEVCSVLGVCETEVAQGNTCAAPRPLTKAGDTWSGAGDLTAAGISDDVTVGSCEMLEAPFASDGVGTPDETWSFTPATSGDYEIVVTSGAETDVLFLLFEGPGCADAACQGWVDNNSGGGDVDRWTFALVGGKTYTLVIDTFGDFAIGPYTIAIGGACEPTCDIGECGNDDGCGGTCGCGVGELCDAGSCVDNTGDTCVSPYEMFADVDGVFEELGDLSGPDVNDDYVAEACPLIDGFENTGRGLGDEVFTFDVTTAGDYAIGVLSDSGVDVFFSLWEGDLCGTGATCVGQVDNGVSGDIDSWTFFLPVGTYTIVVDGYDADYQGAYYVAVSPYEPASECAPDLFFSEYVESAVGSDKVIEIYNGTGADVDLADYQVWRANNGQSVGPGGKFDLVAFDGSSPILADGQTWVICNGDTQASIAAFCDQDAGSSLLASFNGDDYIALVKLSASATVIDAIGVEGEDPGTSWTVGDGTTADHVLYRDPEVSSGDPDWSTAVDGWIALPASDADETLGNSDIGFHDVLWVCQ